jgi:hypothetical protein
MQADSDGEEGKAKLEDIRSKDGRRQEEEAEEVEDLQSDNETQEETGERRSLSPVLTLSEAHIGVGPQLFPLNVTNGRGQGYWTKDVRRERRRQSGTRKFY